MLQVVKDNEKPVRHDPSSSQFDIFGDHLLVESRAMFGFAMLLTHGFYRLFASAAS